MIYYVYTLPPCDDWNALKSVKDYLSEVEGENEEYCDVKEPMEWVNKMREIVKAAVYWEGNPHTEMVSAIPDIDNWPLRMYCAKQPNNGTTFVVSPTPLWHLHQGEYGCRRKNSCVEMVMVETK